MPLYRATDDAPEYIKHAVIRHNNWSGASGVRDADVEGLYRKKIWKTNLAILGLLVLLVDAFVSPWIVTNPNRFVSFILQLGPAVVIAIVFNWLLYPVLHRHTVAEFVMSRWLRLPVKPQQYMEEGLRKGTVQELPAQSGAKLK